MDFDVVVIGAGPAGEVVAGRCADAGLTVAIVEDRLVGGECSYYGCIPSKTLIRPGDVLAAARRVPGAAEAVTGGIDPAAALARRDTMTNGWDDAGQLSWLDDRGIVLLRGRGRVDGVRRVRVTRRDGGAEHHLTARRAVVLATGTSPVVPPVPGLREANPWDNRAATATKEVPRRLLVVGGGAVGCELAQAFRRLGATEVTLVEGAARLLAREEPFAGAEVEAAFAAEGIRVRTGTTLASVRRAAPDAPVQAALSTGERITADEILVAAGRRPATEDLGLETVGVSPRGYVAADDRMRVHGVDDGWLYAVGDCNGRALLTHMGKYQARVAAEVILGEDVLDLVSEDGAPRVTFTDPQVAAVGLTAEQALARGLPIRVVTVGTGEVAGAYTQGDGIRGTSALVVDTRRRVVVGATFTGPGVQEMLHAATIAVTAKVRLEDLWHAVPAFPTVSEVWPRLLEAYGL